MSILATLQGASHDLGGGFMVRRVLPAPLRRSVGPFVFFDHFGPVTVRPGDNFDVRPHPHIGLATVTYLLEGAMLHRDSLGNEQRIEPGAINWMNAGHGIVHSERRPEDLRGERYVSHGLQLWTALPKDAEESEPSFTHTPASALPEFREGEARIRVLVGSAWGRTSPVVTYARTLYLAIRLPAGASLAIPDLAKELAVYPLEAEISVNDQSAAPAALSVVDAGTPVTLRATNATNLMIIGGDPLDGPRTLWWNFVASRPERIDQAADDWAAGRMGRIAGDAEFIPLPARERQ
jgi:hypothetical protein